MLWNWPFITILDDYPTRVSPTDSADEAKKYSTWRKEAIRTTAKASQYISHIFDLKPGPVMLFLRVSDRHQNCHLNHSEAELSWELEIKGNNVIGVFKETGPGWADDRIELEWAAA